MTAPTLHSVEIKAFVPARDFAQSLRFYQRIGFEAPWIGEDLAYLRHEDCSFFLQNFYLAAHADNFLMHFLVTDADAWHRHIVVSGVIEEFGARVGQPADQPWGLRDFTLIDPTGVCWRIGHNLPKVER